MEGQIRIIEPDESVTDIMFKDFLFRKFIPVKKRLLINMIDFKVCLKNYKFFEQ